MTPSARIPWGSKLKNFPWSSGLRPRGSRRPGFSIILNSVSNLSKAESILATYTRIGCFLDNDTAGRNAYANLQRMLGDRLQDMSVHYAGYNDLNEYLCKKLLSQSTEPIKEEKQVQSARRMMQPPKKKGLKI